MPDINKQLIRNLKRFERKAEQAIRDGIEKFEEQLKPKIIEKTPKDTGDLRDSYAFFEVNESNEKFIEYKISFGSGLRDEETGQPYAAFVHEWISSSVRWTEPNTGPKYLLLPTLENAKLLPLSIKVEWGKIKL